MKYLLCAGVVAIALVSSAQASPIAAPIGWIGGYPGNPSAVPGDATIVAGDPAAAPFFAASLNGTWSPYITVTISGLDDTVSGFDLSQFSHLTFYFSWPYKYVPVGSSTGCAFSGCDVRSDNFTLYGVGRGPHGDVAFTIGTGSEGPSLLVNQLLSVDEPGSLAMIGGLLGLGATAMAARRRAI